MKSIVLAEKPSVGRELARVLQCSTKEKGYSEGKDYIVTWAMGHLVELADPEKYDQKYRHWSLNTLPMLPEKMQLKVIRKTSGQFNTVKKLLGRNDAGTLVIATDAGREGELVARWIMRLAGWKGPVKRLWISSQTDAAIRDGFRTMRDGKEYENLFRAAESRAEADWLIGLNVTRALSCKYDVRLSAGRVQTPTLALIAQRENEITSFKPEAFWNLYADFGAYTGLWTGPGGTTRFKDQSRAREIAEKVTGKTGKITGVDKKEKSVQPPLAYDLTALQVDANRVYGYPAKKTLQILQGLYERHKIITYPRTDSRHITRDIVPTIPARLKALDDTPLAKTARALAEGAVNPGKNFVNDAKVTDHHALIPTEERVRLDRLSGEERHIWELVVRRFLEVLSPPYKYLQIKITTQSEGENFISRGRKVLQPGWRQVAGGSIREEEDDREDLQEQTLKDHAVGEEHPVVSADVKQGWTKPPPRYTEGTLVAAMEHAGKFISDKELKKSIEKGGLGTPATRADIIEKIISNYYVERSGKELIPTSRGFELLELVPDTLKSPELTARWEQRLSNIASGGEPHKAFVQDIRKETGRLVDLVKKSTARYTVKGDSAARCPLCGKPLYPLQGKRGKKRLVCQGLSCGYEEGDGRKEKRIGRSLMHKYGGGGGAETTTFGDLLKASQERKKGGKK